MKKLFGRDKPRQPSHRDVDDAWYDLEMMIGEVAANLSEDWTLVLTICERACVDEANAKEAVKALRREIRYGEPTAQLSAARLWAIILRNASDVFLTQMESRKFIDVLADVITSPKTSPVVRDRLLEVLAGAVFIIGSRTSPLPAPELLPFSLKDRNRDRDGLRALWSSLKPVDKPDVGIPFNTEDAMFSPPIAPTRPLKEEAISIQPLTVGISRTVDRRHMEKFYLGESHRDYEGGSSPPLPRQVDILTVVPLQPQLLPRALPALSPTLSPYSPLPPPYGSPRQHDLPPVVPSPTHPLPRVPPAPFPAHSHYDRPPPYASISTLPASPPVPLAQRSHSPTCPPRPPAPSPPPGGLFLVGPSTKVLEEVDNEQHGSSDLKRESVVLDSDEEVHDEVHANMWWLRIAPTRYVYDAVAERTAQHLRERRRPPDIVSFSLDTSGATSSLAVVPTHPPVEEEMPASKPDATIAASEHDKVIDLVIDTHWSGIDLDFSTDTVFAHSSKANLEKMLWEDALLDAQKVIILNSSSYLGYQLKHAALHGAHRYDEAIETFEVMLSKLDDAPEMQLRVLRQQYLSLSEADDAIRKVIYTQLDDAPLRLLDTTSGLLCDREAQICVFKLSTEYKELLSFIIKHADIRTERIKEVVVRYFRCVMLSHMWQGKEPLLHDIKDKVVYKLNPVDGIVKLQSFCKTARNMGYRWAWIDTCCIDQNNNVELQKSLNSMFIWYRQSALTIVYLADVPASSESGALARSAWNTRGWTLPEFLAPEIVLFYQRDWTLYLDDRSCNHKESFMIMGELENATGIDAHSLVTFRPGMAGAREKLRWASTRVTTVQEDVAYSLFGIFGIHLPVIYGEKKQNALGRLLQEIVAQSGDITALDWVGKSSEFNSCLPADITSYKALPCALPSLSEDDIQTSVSRLQNALAIDVALKLHHLLDDLGAPRFANRRLRLPCIAFLVTEVRRSHVQDQGACFAYQVKANGLRDLLITTEDKLTQFSRAKPTLQTFLLVRPWDPYLLELPDFADNRQDMDNWSVRGSMFYDTMSMFSGETGPIDSQLHPRALRLIVRLGQPFGAFLLARQRGGEYKRIASDRNIIAQVKEVADSVHRMHVRTLEIS